VPCSRNASSNGMVGVSLPHLRKLSNKDTYALAKKLVYNRQLDKALTTVHTC
jgi:hypothetical protein